MEKPLRLIYIIGRYPELTTTFIEREIKTLRQFGNIEVQPVSLRYPLTPNSISPEHQEIRKNTMYLVPESLWAFNFLIFLIGNLYFILFRPLVYFKTLIYLLTHLHPNLKTRLMTVLHFWQGVYTAYLLRQCDFDHLHAHFIDRAVVVALVIGRLLNKPYSLTAHANDIYTKQILMREKIVNAKFAVTVSQYNKAYLLKTFSGLDADTIHVLHPWVELSQFIPAPAQPTCQQLHILSVGRLVEKKGFTYLVDACHLLQQQNIDFECRIIGSGSLRAELGKKVTHYGLESRVQLMGGQPQSEVLRLLREWANVFVLACVIAKDGDRDGIPVSLAEAMAMEIPVISTDIVGIGELVKPGTGLLVLPRDPVALAEALQIISDMSASARAEMGRQGRAVIDAEFNLINGTRQLARLFREPVT